MFEKYKINKYLDKVESFVRDEDFLNTFLDIDILSGEDSVMKESTYICIEKVLKDVYNTINESLEYSKLIRTVDGYSFPTTLGWIKIHVINNEPKGLTMYMSKNTYKMYLNTYSKTVSLNVLSIEKPRYSLEISKNLRRA